MIFNYFSLILVIILFYPPVGPALAVLKGFIKKKIWLIWVGWSADLRRVCITLTCLSVSPQFYIDFVSSDQRGIPRHIKGASNVGRPIVLPLCWVHHRRLEFRIQLAGVYCSDTVNRNKGGVSGASAGKFRAGVLWMSYLRARFQFYWRWCRYQRRSPQKQSRSCTEEGRRNGLFCLHPRSPQWWCYHGTCHYERIIISSRHFIIKYADVQSVTCTGDWKYCWRWHWG